MVLARKERRRSRRSGAHAAVFHKTRCAWKIQKGAGMAIGDITRLMREQKEIEQKIERYKERIRPLVQKKIIIERKIYGRDRTLTTAFSSEGVRLRVND
jgi:hypothetical protein